MCVVTMRWHWRERGCIPHSKCSKCVGAQPRKVLDLPKKVLRLSSPFLGEHLSKQVFTQVNSSKTKVFTQIG
jgi:hypothetical protein